MKKQTILVTGSNGYIGAVLVPLLLKTGYKVIGVDREFYPCEVKPIANTSFKLIKKDIRDLSVKDFLDIDHLVHLAALSNDPLGEINPDLTMEINQKQTIRIAKLAKKAGVKRLIFSSSCSVYGCQKGSLNEQSLLKPLTAYAKAKAGAEKGLLKLASQTFSPVILRNATVYGASPNMRFDLVLNNLVAWAYFTKTINLLSDGQAWRPLIHVRDLAKAIILTLKAPRQTVDGQIFNIGSNAQNIKIRALAKEIHRQMPQAIVKITKDNPDKRSYKVDFSKASQQLKFKADVTFAKGIKEILLFLKNHQLTEKQVFGPKFIRLKQLKALLDEQLVNQHLR